MRGGIILLAVILLAGCGAPGGGEGKGNGSVPRSDLPLETDTNRAIPAPTNLTGSSQAQPTGTPNPH
jgi:hypothetical protein